MQFKTMGKERKEGILFFHAMGVTGASSERAARYLENDYFCIMPTSNVCCKDQKYLSKHDEIRQIENYLQEKGITKLDLVVASTIDVDLTLAFLS